jgi:hypothetical protein
MRIGRKILLRVFFSLMQTLLSAFHYVDIPLKTKKERINDKCLIQETKDKSRNSSMFYAY